MYAKEPDLTCTYALIQTQKFLAIYWKMHAALYALFRTIWSHFIFELSYMAIMHWSYKARKSILNDNVKI